MSTRQICWECKRHAEDYWWTVIHHAPIGEVKNGARGRPHLLCLACIAKTRTKVETKGHWLWVAHEPCAEREIAS